MTRLLVFISTMLFVMTGVFGQTAIINDQDGYTNVRENPDGKAKVVYKLRANEVFFYDDEGTGESERWVSVYIPKDKYALGCDGMDHLTGYIHKSRLSPLEGLAKPAANDFSFSYTIRPFSTDDKIIDYPQENYIGRINGMRFYGTDGEAPNNEIQSVNIKVQGESIEVPSALYRDLFEVTNDFEIYVQEDTYFVQQWNSDGAGGYLLVWVINKEKVLQRMIMIP